MLDHCARRGFTREQARAVALELGLDSRPDYYDRLAALERHAFVES
jgi:hypothetical protein